MHRIEAYTRLAIIFIIIITILYLPILLILRKKRKNIIGQLGKLSLFCSIFLIIFATILFVPLGFFIPAIKKITGNYIRQLQ